MGTGPETDAGPGLGQAFKKKGVLLQCIQHLADGFAQAMVARLGFNDCRTVIKPLAANRKKLSRLFSETLMKAWLNAEQQSAVGHLAHLGCKARHQIAVIAMMRPTALSGRIQGSFKISPCKTLRATFIGRQTTVRRNRRYRLPAPGNEARRINGESPLMCGSTYHTNGEAGASLAFSIMINANTTCPAIPFMTRTASGQFWQ